MTFSRYFQCFFLGFMVNFRVTGVCSRFFTLAKLLFGCNVRRSEA